MDQSIPLCVDLDGTLLRADLLRISFGKLLIGNPFYLLFLPFWLARGRAFLKREVARRVSIDASRLPYHSQFLAFLKEEHKKGRLLVLATASDERLARAVADHLGLFAEVLASNGRINLSRLNKLRALQSRFGPKGFDYAGNDEADLAIWAGAHEAILVNPGARLAKKAQAVATIARLFCGFLLCAL